MIQNQIKALAGPISYGLGYSYTDYFYVTNYDKSYQLDKLKDTANPGYFIGYIFW